VSPLDTLDDRGQGAARFAQRQGFHETHCTE